MSRAAIGFLLCALPWIAAVAIAQEVEPSAPVTREFTVPLRDGALSSAELAASLLEAYGFDGHAVGMPDVRIDVRGARGWLKLTAFRKLLLDTVRFRRARDGGALRVIVDRERTRAVRRELRARVARLFGDELTERTYALDLPPDLDPSRSLVVLVHGVESGPDVWDDLREFLIGRDAPPQVATFAYPNDEACERIARELSARLRAIGEQRIAIVAHSMGGLVARAVIEDPALDPGNVDALVMIGTPNRGSNVAGMRFALEAAHLLQRVDGDVAFGTAILEGARDNLLDGLGEAGGDLLPESVFLTRLNRRARHPDVRYHLVLGTRGVLSAVRLAAIRVLLVELAGRNAALRIAAPKLDAWLADLDELIDGRGDGAVSVARGRLAGVTAELVPLDHVGLVRWRGLLGPAAEDGQQPVFAIVARALVETR